MEFVNAFGALLFGVVIGYIFLSILLVLVGVIGRKEKGGYLILNISLFTSWWWSVFWVIYSTTFSLLYLMKGDVFWMWVHVVWLVFAIVVLFGDSIPDEKV